MNSIKVLDVTLRDGGCVNEFNFGQDYMDKILEALERSGVDFIELGYIDEKNGSVSGRTQYSNEQVISTSFLKHKLPGITYVAMMDYGKFDVDKFQDRQESGIDGIRLAFHKKNWKDVTTLGRTIIDKGYQFYVQPMLTLRYSDMELLELIKSVNEYLPDASGFYIVDSFGEMRGTDVTRLMHLVDNNLNPGIALGFHSHNNLQLSYSNAMSLLSFPTNRNLMLDASVMGMGKGAGNLNTELLLEHLNLYYGKTYRIAPLLELIDQVINTLHKEMYWGYAAEYYLSSVNHCTPSYAGHFYNKHMLPIDQVAELLGMIEEDKKNSFDRQYAENLYLKYNASKTFDDTDVVDRLRKQFAGKRVLLVAPGKSIKDAADKISEIVTDRDVVSISLNNFEYDTDYVLTTRAEVFAEAQERGKAIIAPSRLTQICMDMVQVIDYQKWIIVDDETYDSSSVIALRLLEELGAREIILAGFDGFSININENYFNTTLRHPVTEEQAVQRNEFYKNLIGRVSEKVKVRFLTKSLYQ
ncbi:isopropylmalate/homocitrate/citramalate synthase [Desulfosporosinus orientis DSM 765]|uniref:Isopropylmalate/homocitrate/citramalate synthase n=1 Tax=Desulfosporosinus orientis (strain ATCC 19365 / DSM 765 / NCIMB 8382 / VKM B-1628 / Singapore I) TaxID=768706 RepID=G7W763_DESOD|nr:aldolase catalytic domain-containing protein [Desulfosporosinus orientis]AET70571.1 isopropylmalate/homocitrate/citramalate synthase [Desulfosporosinus orientis DSM 765]